jgi:hypothetical protein
MDDGALVGKVLDCTAFSSTFPSAVSHEISRDAILNLIDDFFLSGIQLVTLDGKPDIGKTRIVAQFALQRPSHAVSVFIKPNSWFMSEPSLLYADIAGQMHWALKKCEMPDPHIAQETLVRQLSFDLNRMAKRSGALYYFLIDGLDDIADGLSQFAGTLLAILPLEYTNFRFLVSGDAKWIPFSLVPKLTRKSYPVPGLSLEETIAYFNDCSLQRSQIEELYKSCGRGTPGYLASARRLIEGGIDPATLINQLPRELPSPFEIEWQAVEGLGELLFDVLATLSFDTNPHSITELASMFEVNDSDVRQILTQCSFVELQPSNDSPVTYVSASFRQFVADKLSGRRDATWGKLAEYLLARRNTEKALELLPSYLEQAGRPQELLNALNPSSLIQLVERTDSFILLQRQSEMGLDTSLRLKKLGEALRFSVQLAVVADVGTPRFARAEIMARLAVGDYETALSLAKGATLKSHRLRLLAALAKFQTEKGLTPETIVLEAIDRLASQIDVREIADDVVDLCSDLVYSRPELAIKLISTAGKERNDDRSMDWAFVRLSFLASMNRGSTSEELSKTSIDLRSRITDPVARRFSSAISLVVGNYTPMEVLAEVEKLESPGDQLFLLRQWCARTESPENAAPIIDYAVHLAIRSTAYSPTAADFRDLAVALPSIAPEQIPSLITAFDIQREAAHRLGPPQDYIELQLLLAEAEAQVSQRHAGERLLQTYYDIRSIADLELRIVCTGLLVAASPRIDPAGAFEDSADVRNVSEAEFMEEIRVLLRSTADHYVITRRVIKAVSRSRPDLAIQIAKELNIQSRRDEALEDIVEHNLDAPSQGSSYDFLASVLGQFDDLDTEEQVVQRVLKRFCRMPSPQLTSHYPKIRTYLERACSIVNPVIACDALSCARAILQKVEGEQSMVQKIESTLRKRWESIDDPSAKLEAGYDTAVALADYSRETAESYLKAAEELKSEHSYPRGPTYLNSLRLAIRAFSGLLPQQLSSSSDFERLTLQLERVPSRLERIYLWTDLALRCFKHERSNDGKHIVNQRIRPLLDKLRETAEFEWREGLGTAAPALYEVNSATTLDILLLLPSAHRDDALDSILRFKATKVPTDDPFRADADSHYNLDFAECLEILKLVDGFDIDFFVYKHIERVASSAAWRHNRHQIADTQKNEIAQRIRALAAKKFPNPK